MQTTQNIADHLIWRQEVDDLLARARATESEAERVELYDRAHALRCYVASTPTDSPAGIAAQISLAIEADDAGSQLGPVEITALETARDALASQDDGVLVELWRTYLSAWRAAEADDGEADAAMARIEALEHQAESMPAHGPAGIAVHLRLSLFQRCPDSGVDLLIRRSNPPLPWLDPYSRHAIAAAEALS